MIKLCRNILLQVDSNIGVSNSPVRFSGIVYWKGSRYSQPICALFDATNKTVVVPNSDPSGINYPVLRILQGLQRTVAQTFQIPNAANF